MKPPSISLGGDVISTPLWSCADIKQHYPCFVKCSTSELSRPLFLRLYRPVWGLWCLFVFCHFSLNRCNSFIDDQGASRPCLRCAHRRMPAAEIHRQPHRPGRVDGKRCACYCLHVKLDWNSKGPFQTGALSCGRLHVHSDGGGGWGRRASPRPVN